MEQYSFYYQKNNHLFERDIISICYHANSKEIKTYGLTSSYVLILVAPKNINDIEEKKKINYFKEIEKLFSNNVILRIQCECLLGIYGDSHCDCESQRLEAINIIKEKGGILVHYPQEAQGWGLHYKLQELELQVSGREQSGEFIGQKNRDDAQKLLLGCDSFKDNRGYNLIVKILTDLKLNKKNIYLITENQSKINTLNQSKINILKYSDYIKKEITSDNLSEYLIKVLNYTHDVDEKVLDNILALIESREYNERTLLTIVDIVDRIKNDETYALPIKYKNKILKTYDNIICGEEKEYICKYENTIKNLNKFSCKVNSCIFKMFHNLYKKNIFSRMSLEKIYVFKNKYNDEIIKIRTSRVLKVDNEYNIFYPGQMFVIQRTFNGNNKKIIESETNLSRLRSYFENSNYDYVKRIENITYVSEGIVPGLSIFIKRIPNVDNRILDIYGKKEKIQELINKIVELDYITLLALITNKDYENEDFSEYNLRFSDINTAINEEIENYKIINGEKIIDFYDETC